MRTLFYRLRLLILTPALLLPATAHAQTAAAGLIKGMIADIVGMFSGLWGIVAVLMIVIIAVRMVAATDEGTMEKAKAGIGGVIAGMMFILMSTTMVALLNTLGSYNPLTGGGEIGFVSEVAGISQWISAMAGMIGMLIIIAGVFKAVVSFGDETAYATARTTVAHVVAGLLIIAFNEAIAIAVFNNNPNPLMTLIMIRVQFILGIMTLVAMAVVIYAGIRMVANFGNEEAFTQAKGIIFRAAGGLVLIVVSFVLTQFLIYLFN